MSNVFFLGSPLLLVFIFGFLCSQCSDDADKFEQLAKLRALGVSVDQVMVTPSPESDPKVIQLTLHAVVPKGEQITIALFEDQDDFFSPRIEGMEIDQDSVSYREYETLRYYTVNASFAVPFAKTLEPLMRAGAINLRYGFELTATDETEKVVGKIPIISSTSDDARKVWKSPEVRIVGLSTKDKLGKNSDIDVDIESTVENDEEFKIGWFTSSGSFKNRRAASTQWSTSDDDKQLLIATVRTKRSRAFAIDLQEFNFE
jgi:hypothetical protein